MGGTAQSTAPASGTGPAEPDPAGARSGGPGRIRAWAAALIITLWGGASLFLVATLSVSHLATYPLPDALVPLADYAATQRTVPGQRLVLHLIPETCSCTNGLFDHLLARGPRPGTDERIVFVEPGEARRRRAREAGYRFTELSAEAAVSTLGLSAAPVLVVLDGEDRLRYAGGYFDHPAAVNPRDLEVLSALDAQGAAEALPVFGCALEESLRRAVDPLGLASGR